jgi:hypothetical protein
MKTTPCSGCGKPMVFSETMDKKKIPLDSRAPVYRVVTQAEDGTPLIVERDRYAYVTHFATCPKASDFSAGRKTDLSAAR